MTPDKQQHLFYGMTGAQYDAGMRYDWEKGTVRTTDKGVTMRFPIIHEDGTPWTVECNRPNMTGTITGVTDNG